MIAANRRGCVTHKIFEEHFICETGASRTPNKPHKWGAFLFGAERANLIRFSVSNGFTKKGEPLNWEWGRKIENTVQFKLHLKFPQMSSYSKYLL
jgi:hypothetical protein